MEKVTAMQNDPAFAAVKTYNYLRIALAALVLLLFASVVIEWASAGGCLQPSISAYYFTPARSVFVGVLVTMGVCLLALKGSSDGEDGLMNLAGMLAPGVAFVPTTFSGRCGAAGSATGVADAVANNMPALFLTGVVVGVVAAVVARRESGGMRLSVPDRLGLGLTVLVLGSGMVWFVVAPDAFREHGHAAAAVPMFLAIIAVVWLNARDVQEAVQRGRMPAERRRYVAMYRAIAVAMLSALAATVAISLATRSTSLVFWVEVVLIGLFAVFWVVQTTELWNRGLRGP